MDDRWDIDDPAVYDRDYEEEAANRRLLQEEAHDQLIESLTDDDAPALPESRGLRFTPRVPGTYGGEVWVSESSAADAPHIWLRASEEQDRLRSVSVHLTAGGAWALAEHLRSLVAWHYQGDARPAGAQPARFDRIRDDRTIVLFDECGHWTRADPEDGTGEIERVCPLCATVRPVGVELVEWVPVDDPTRHDAPWGVLQSVPLDNVVPFRPHPPTLAELAKRRRPGTFNDQQPETD